MDAKRKTGRRDLEKEKLWRELMAQRQQNGGQSVRAFCEEWGVTESQFYGWRTRLRERDAEPSPSAGVGEVVSARTKTRPAGTASRSGFVELVRPVGAGGGAGVYIRFDDRIDIVIERGFDAPTLKMALACLADGAYVPVRRGPAQ